jgi:mannonate dehydratase
MDRRTLVAGACTGVAAAAELLGSRPAQAQARPAAKARLRAGHQHAHAPEVLKLLAAFGVNSICSGLPSRRLDENWSVAGLTRLREQVESFGIKLEFVPLPLSSSRFDRAEHPNIMLGKSPERDREIDDICRMIENCAKVGIPGAKYNMTLLGVVSTDRVAGRGGASQRAFTYEKSDPDQLTAAGRVTEEMMWERITYFLERVVPVAEANRVRLACHPHDPGMPKGRGYRGIERVLGSVDGLKKFVSIKASPYHGLNFCQGTVSEMLKEPGREIYEVIRYFGSRGKIFNVHFRNIKGGFLNFTETFPDNGDVDMIRALRTYKEVGYDGMIMPDHVPTIEGDEDRLRAFSFAFGYIQAAIQAVNSES